MSETIPIGNARSHKPDHAAAADASEPDTTINLWQRIVAVQAAAKGIEKKGRAPQEMGGFAFVRDTDVFDAARELFSTHGIAYTCTTVDVHEEDHGATSSGKPIYRSYVHLRIRLRNMDNPAEVEELDWHGVGDDMQDKGLQKAGTSAVKYALMKALLIGGEASSDPDAVDATGGEGRQERSQGGGKRNVLIEPGCPDCGGSLAIVYRPGARSFVGHAEWKPGADACKWRPAFDVQAQWIRDAEAAGAAAEMMSAPSGDAPPSGTVTRVELVATAIERGREYKRIDAVACEKLLRDHGWSGEGKESQWIATLTEGGKLISLISNLNSRIASCPAPIPM